LILLVALRWVALAAKLIADGRLRTAMLFVECGAVRAEDTELLADAELARLDPALGSVVNVNASEDYAAARSRPAAEIVVQCFGALAGRQPSPMTSSPTHRRASHPAFRAAGAPERGRADGKSGPRQHPQRQ